jgi:hypothetical protein
MVVAHWYFGPPRVAPRFADLPLNIYILYIAQCDCMEAHAATKENPLRPFYLQHLANDYILRYHTLCMYESAGRSIHGKSSAPFIWAPTHC